MTYMTRTQDENQPLPEIIADVAVFHMNDGEWPEPFSRPDFINLRETHRPVCVFRAINVEAMFGYTNNGPTPQVRGSWLDEARGTVTVTTHTVPVHDIITNETHARSTMVGDVVVFGGDAWRCESVGWTRYTVATCPGPACCMDWDSPDHPGGCMPIY